MNSKQEVGDPCCTPIEAVIRAVPITQFVDIYIAIIADNILMP